MATNKHKKGDIMAIKMSLQDAINYVAEKMTPTQISRVLGVSVNQIHKYLSGFTKSCSDKVADKIYDNFRVGKEPILLDFWNDEEEYLHYRRLREQTGEGNDS
jgi:predicted transcriptional regulator